MSDLNAKKFAIKSTDLKPGTNICQYCGYNFSQKSTLTRHLNKNYCRQLKETHHLAKVTKPPIKNHKKDTRLSDVNPLLIRCLQNNTKKIETLERELAELKEQPRVNNQILQVVCIGNNDNYLDILTKQWGDFNKALEYIKDCALSSLVGDCKLIEKIYLEGQKSIVDPTCLNNNLQIPPSIRYLDKSRTKIEYFNEKTEKVIENKELFGRKLANNLQNSYLKGVNYLINKNLDNHLCPNKFLEEYDLQIWNQHIYDLSDVRYHRKIVNQLNIPMY